MTNRIYRLLVGIIIIVSLYFEQPTVIYGLIAFIFFEGLTNLRLPILLSKIWPIEDDDPNEGCLAIKFSQRFNFDAERAWRLLVSFILGISLFFFSESLWFFPWFMGFAILGAGASGVCPMFLSLKWVGFK